jgi:glucan phosphoethanolaminetransferase (alkaline phosphatase superfamily)
MRGVWLAARRLVSSCRREKWWAVCMLVFVLVWTIELFLVQWYTLVYPNVLTERFAFFAPKIRFVLDLLFISSLTLLLRRRWLCLAVGASFFVYLGLITYYQYFLRPLSILTIINNWREGLEVGGFALDMFPRRIAAVLCTALAIQVAALILCRNFALPRAAARLGGAVTLACYLSLYAVTIYLDPLYFIQSTRGVGRLGEVRGYLGGWFAEWYYLGGDQVLAQALELRNIKYDRLTPIETEIPIHKRLVILQLESFDTNVLDYRINGKEVTPFLNQLRKSSMYYRVTAMHASGCSADADFAALNGVRGSDHQNTYLIAGYPYENTTPQELAQCGFDVFSFHGAGGEFYSRRNAYEKMGLTGMSFREELENNFGLKADKWGIRDDEVLTVAGLKLRESTKPTCHFIITLTSHTPYVMLRPQDEEIFKPARTTEQRYLNSMRFVDNCLRNYITSLGSGTTILMYADHPTEEMEFREMDFRPDRVGGREFVPCMIYDTDQDLSKLQKTRSQAISTDGTLNLVDVINYLRGQVARNYGGQASAPERS